MESCGGVTGEGINTSKRKNRDDDEISPRSLQKNKEQRVREMATVEEKFDIIMNAMNEIKSDIKLIKEENSEFKQKLATLDERVSKVEEKIDSACANEQKSIEQLKSEIKSLQSHNNSLEQINHNRSVIIRNLPKEIRENQMHTRTTINNLLNILQLEIKEDDYEAYSFNGKNDVTANINVEFSTVHFKRKFMQAYRVAKKAERDPKLVVEKIFPIDERHKLNGTTIRINNKLTTYNMKLLQYARQHVPMHFSYAFDSDDGWVKVKHGPSIKKVASTEEIDKLVSKTQTNVQKGAIPRNRSNIPQTDRQLRSTSAHGSNSQS